MLIILDGFGMREEVEGNAHRLAHTPVLDGLLNDHSAIALKTSGPDVGLPPGVMGNSEVGHMNMGAGRVVQQILVRINEALGDGSFANHATLREHMRRAKDAGSTYHLMGLLSDGGVHSHIDHLEPVLKAARSIGLQKVAYHAITDGRDTGPRVAAQYFTAVEAMMRETGVGETASITGRYYAMDRDKRWDRTALAYNMLAHGQGEEFPSAHDALEAAYAQSLGDEFVLPAVINPDSRLRAGDALLCLNFRPDRMRQIVRALGEESFEEFATGTLGLDIVTMTSYEEAFNYPVLFPPRSLNNILPELLSQAGYRQMRVAETEKYAHVTYFFNGGREEPFAGEIRRLAPSQKVATYDLAPEMRAVAVTDIAVDAWMSDETDAVILNLANADMVGHTGKLAAGILAMECIDQCLGRLMEVSRDKGVALFLTADHGNIEMMIDPETHGPHTAHTTLDVPLALMDNPDGFTLAGAGRLADIAPTILEYIGLPVPDEMTGQSRLARER